MPKRISRCITSLLNSLTPSENCGWECLPNHEKVSMMGGDCVKYVLAFSSLRFLVSIQLALELPQSVGSCYAACNGNP